ncbi:MAG: helix-turn-helix domain-containing protein, partial [Pseudonocardiaceae bacterium]
MSGAQRWASSLDSPLRRRFRPGASAGSPAKRGQALNAEEARTIGARARMIRRRRGLSLEVVAGLAGITAQYLSMLERG